jgi:diketogulonate reductase-like aldo/keto reductase
MLKMPQIMYGTAWKKERTCDLVVAAIRAGFRGIDTACQPKHYYEPGVGLALQRLAAEDGIKREEIFLQTKFTPIRGQDPKNVPYDTKAPLAIQVQQSLQKSLQNLQTSYLDSLVLHSPLDTHQNTMLVWREFEAFVRQGTVRQLGISNNYDLASFQAIFRDAEIKPTILQNRF